MISLDVIYLVSTIANLHPIIDAILCDDFEAVQEMLLDAPRSNPNYKYGCALRLFKQHLRSEADEDKKTQQTLSAALATPPQDRELYSALLFVAVRFAVSMEQSDEVKRIFSCLESLNDRTATLRCQLLTKLAEWHISQAEGNYSKQSATLTEAIDLLREKKGHLWVKFVEWRTVDGIMNDDFARAERDLKELEPYQDTAALKSVFCSFSGRIQEGLDVLKTVQNEATTLLLGSSLLLKAGRLAEARDYLERLKPFQLPPDRYECLLALEALAKHEIPQALTHAQRAMLASETSHPESKRGILYTLVWIELANKNTVSARAILRQLDPRESAPTLHAEWARLYLLEGDDFQAAAHFRRLLDKELPALVEDKLRFAWEIPVHRLCHLWSLAQMRNASSPPISQPLRNRKDGDARNRISLVGESTAIREIVAMISRIASLESPVLITGETGTGKEVIAQLLHQQSSRAREPFIAVNCGSLSEELIESELFGHKKGAFTGANQSRQGLFLAAGKGTIFLDEINATSPRLQASLLRVIEYGEVRPLGSDQLSHNQARVLAASNEPLEAMIKNKRFRSDLYFRLSRLHLLAPPLRDRKEDIPLLCRYFLSESLGGAPFTISNDFLEALKNYSWPGNVRELKNKLETMILFSGERLTFSAKLFSQIQTPFTTEAIVEPAPTTRERTPSEGLPSKTGTRIWDKHQHLLELFQEHQRLTQIEVIQKLECSPNTAKRYLKVLTGEGLIRRICTSGNLCTSFFVYQGEQQKPPATATTQS